MATVSCCYLRHRRQGRSSSSLSHDDMVAMTAIEQSSNGVAAPTPHPPDLVRSRKPRPPKSELAKAPKHVRITVKKNSVRYCEHGCHKSALLQDCTAVDLLCSCAYRVPPAFSSFNASWRLSRAFCSKSNKGTFRNIRRLPEGAARQPLHNRTHEVFLMWYACPEWTECVDDGWM